MLMDKLLEEWELLSLWPIFRHHEINDFQTLKDFMTFSSQEDIKELIPKVGLRVKLLKKYQEQLQVLNDQSQLISSQPLITTSNNFVFTIPSDLPNISGPITVEEESLLRYRSVQNHNSEQSQQKFVVDTNKVDNSTIESIVDENFQEDPPFKKKKILNIEYVDLIEVLNDHALGPSVITHYKAFSELDNRIQGRLCDIVILFYLKRYGMVLTEKNIEKLAQDFIKYFPNECIESYYVASETKKKSKTGKAIGAKGKLVNAYKNNCTWIREGLQWEKIAKANTENSVNTLIHTDNNTSIDSKAWLVTNREEEKLLMHWELCYEQRRKEINSKKFKSLVEIFENWPILKENIGLTLIEIDFKKLFGTINFGVQWENYFKITVKFFQEKSKNLVIQDLCLLDQTNLSEDSKHILQTKIFIELLVPKSNKTSTKSAKNNSGIWRPDATDAQSGVFLHVKIPGDIEKAVRKKSIKYGKLGLPVQPFIIIVGPNLQSITSFYVRIDSVQYELKSFFKCLETILQLSLVFKVSYSLSSEKFWYFFQRGICEITTDEDTKIPAVFDLINKLKRRQNEV